MKELFSFPVCTLAKDARGFDLSLAEASNGTGKVLSVGDDESDK